MTSGKPAPAFNLPYNQFSHYWLAVFYNGTHAAVHDALVAHGMKKHSSLRDAYIMHLSGNWSEKWKSIRLMLSEHRAERDIEASLIPGEEEPDAQELVLKRKSIGSMDAISDSLWLGEAMIEDRIVCYMQPVLDKRNKIFGYEAFARVETEHGLIGGGKIIEASKGLSAEYILDRHLHVKAITSFITSDLEGFLFINFVPGFIHRPEKYLEGLTDSAKFHGMPAKRIVLDFTPSETGQDLIQLRAIFDYCRSKGYSLSLDDIASVSMAKKILESIRPDFIKLDIDLVRGISANSNLQIVSELVEIAHISGATVLAEGVETEAAHQQLLKAGVDLFQGYLFSPPVAVSALKKAAG